MLQDQLLLLKICWDKPREARAGIYPPPLRSLWHSVASVSERSSIF